MEEDLQSNQFWLYCSAIPHSFPFWVSLSYTLWRFFLPPAYWAISFSSLVSSCIRRYTSSSSCRPTVSMKDAMCCITRLFAAEDRDLIWAEAGPTSDRFSSFQSCGRITPLALSVSTSLDLLMRECTAFPLLAARSARRESTVVASAP